MLFVWLKYEWHTSIANHLKKEYTTGDRRHLCTFSYETHIINVNAGKAFQVDQSREGVYIHINTGRQTHNVRRLRALTLMHGVHEKVVRLNNFDRSGGVFHVQWGPHRRLTSIF